MRGEAIACLDRNEPPVFEPGLAELVARGRAGGCLRFTSDPSEALRDAEILVPSDGRNDRQAVERHAVEAAAIDFPRKHRLLADGFGFAAHDAAAGEDLRGARFDVLAADGLPTCRHW